MESSPSPRTISIRNMDAFIPPSISHTSRFTSARGAVSPLRRQPRATTTVKRPTCSLTAPAHAAGSITVNCDVNEIAVGDTLMIEYTPPEGSSLLDSAAGTLLWTGGFNGWRGESKAEGAREDGSEQTLHFPFTPLLDGRFRVSVTVPDYAKSVDFCVTSANAWSWDDNNGNMYTLPVKYRKKVDKDGQVIEFESNDKTQEVRREAKLEEDAPRVMVPEEEARLHRLRGEAALVGEEQGLGNILISQARDTFDMLDRDKVGTITAQDVGKALEHLSFDLSDDELNDLVKRFVKDEGKVTMVEFMLLYSELELNDYGLQMV